MGDPIRKEELIGKLFVLKTAPEHKVYFFLYFKTDGRSLFAVQNSDGQIFDATWSIYEGNSIPVRKNEPHIFVKLDRADWNFTFCRFGLNFLGSLFRSSDSPHRLGIGLGTTFYSSSPDQSTYVVFHATEYETELYNGFIEARRKKDEEAESERREKEWLEAEKNRQAERARQEQATRQQALIQAEKNKAEKQAAEDAFWNSPEGQKVRAAQMLAEIERQKAIDQANIRIMEQERVAAIGREMREDERRSQEDLIRKVRDL